MLFYVNSETFHRALAKFPVTEKQLREISGISEPVWYGCKRGNKPFLPRTIAKIAAFLNVEPDKLIACSTDDKSKKARLA